MPKKTYSGLVWGLVAVGGLGIACTVETKSDSAGTGGTGGNAGHAGANSGGSAGSTSSGGLNASGGNGPSAGGADDGGNGQLGNAGEPGRAGSSAGGDAGAGGEGNAPETGLWNCGSRDVTNATVVTDAVETDTSWSGTVYLKGEIQVLHDATLTIEPGTNIVMGPDAELVVGWDNQTATLKASGTEDAPIRFCGQAGDAGFWRGVAINHNVTSNSELHDVLISDAGSTDQALDLATDIDVHNVQVRNAERDGVRADDFRSGSRALAVDGVGGTAVVLTSAAAVDHFPLGSTFSNNANNVASIAFTSIGADTHFRDLGIPYSQDDVLQILSFNVVIEPGVHYLFGSDATFDVGWNSNVATLTAAGTAAQPIVFDGITAKSGAWGGVKIEGKVTSDSIVSHLEIRHAGGNDGYALDVEAPVTLDNVLLSDNDAGAYIAARGVDKASSNLTITKGEQRPLTVHPDALVSLPQGGTFTGNAVDEVAVEGGYLDVDGTVPNPGVPYRVLTALSTNGTHRITLTAGSEFIMPGSDPFEVGWNYSGATLIAVGTASKPIRFVGGEDTAGYWGGLLLGSKVQSDSKLDYVEISGGKDACLTLHASIPVTNSTFSNCDGYGILKDGDDSRDYATSNTFTDVVGGDVGTL